MLWIVQLHEFGVHLTNLVRYTRTYTVAQPNASCTLSISFIFHFFPQPKFRVCSSRIARHPKAIQTNELCLLFHFKLFIRMFLPALVPLAGDVCSVHCAPWKTTDCRYLIRAREKWNITILLDRAASGGAASFPFFVCGVNFLRGGCRLGWALSHELSLCTREPKKRKMRQESKVKLSLVVTKLKFSEK